MAIRNVNGRNVYILEPREPTGKTTSGRSWATLYSDLRWQVWEEIQKNEAAMLKMEMASAKVRKDYYDDKIKVLQDQRKQLQSAALKAERGNTSSAYSEALRAAQGLERMSRTSGGKIVTKEVIQKDMFGEPVIDPATGQVKTIPVTTTTEAVGGVDPTAFKIYKTIADRFLAGEATEAEVKEAAAEAGISPEAAVPPSEGEAPAAEGKAPAPAGPTIDQQIEALDRDLEQLLLQRQAAGGGLDANLLGRTRESFASQVGVIGQGGGPFGLAPRRRRTMPYVQESLAQERIDQFLQDREQFISGFEKQKIDQLDSEVAKLEQLKKARQDVSLIVADDPEDIRNQALLGGLDDEIERQNRTIRLATDDVGKAREQAALQVRRRIESDERFTPRAPGELLRRDIRRDAAPPQPIRPAATATVSMGEPTIEAAPRPSGGMEDLGLEPMSPEERQAAEEAVRAAGVEGRKAEGELPAVETEQRPLPAYERAFEPEPRPAGLGGVPETPVPVGPPIELDEPSAIRNPDILDQSGFVPAPDLVEDARGYFRGMTIQRGDERPKTIRFPERYFGGEKEMVKEYLKERIREAAPVGVDQSQEIEAVEAGPPQASSRQRKDKYKFDVVSEGTKLARTPKKLQRLAKTNLPEENRPEHYVIVDKLYDVNRGKEQAFKMTYDEISRAFQNDPQKRADAHKYLVAKDILEADVSEPLA